MKKQIKLWLPIALCILAWPLNIFATNLDSIALQGRIQNLELQRENLEARVDLYKDELALQVDDRADHNTLIFWIAAAIALFGGASILVSFWMGVRKAKQSILIQAEGIIESEVKLKLPGITEAKIKEAVTQEVSPLNRVLERERENEEFRLETEILCLGETLEDAEAAVARLSKLGFKRLKPYVPTEKKLPPYAVYFINLFRSTPESGWSLLTDPNLQTWIDADTKFQSLFFYYLSERKGPIDTKRMHPFIGFANRGSTVDTNLIDAIRDYRLHLNNSIKS